jgi:hypothetical protein
VTSARAGAMLNYGLWFAFLLLAPADCLLNLRGVRDGGTLGPDRSLRQDVTADRERRN